MTQLQLRPGWLSRDVERASQVASEIRAKRENVYKAARKAHDVNEKAEAKKDDDTSERRD